MSKLPVRRGNFRTARFDALLLCLGIWTLVSTTEIFAAQSRITVDNPRGGEIYITGQSQIVRVLTPLKTVTVALSRDGGQTFETLGTIDRTAAELTSRTTLTWQVSLPASNVCLIRVSNGVYTVTSGMFAIVSAPAGQGAADVSGQNGPQIPDGSITTSKLATAAVTGVKLADGSVSSPKISSGQASPNMFLSADGLGGANWTIMPAATAIDSTAGDSVVAAVNNAATTGTINANRLDPNVALKNQANLFTTGTQTIQTGGDATVGLVVKANSSTQSADLQQWQDSTGATLASVSATGAITGNVTGVISGDGSGLTNLNASNIASGALAVANGGTNATTAAGALANLGVGVVSNENANRALAASDNGATLVCAAAPTFTVNAGMPNGFGVAAKGVCTFTAGTGVTITDVRVSGQVSPWCAIVQTGIDTYDVIGGKP